MVVTHVFRTGARKLTAACALSAAALAGASACGGAAQAVPPAHQSTQQPTPGTATSAAGTKAAGSSPSAAAGTTSPAGKTTTDGDTASAGAKPAAVPECGGRDLKITQGYGTQSEPDQAGSVVFTNVSDRTCTLRGYPDVAITEGATVINAKRVLNGWRGDQPPLSSPPLVTLAPGATAYSVVQWTLSHGQSCYPSGTGTFEVTAPDTTVTVVQYRGLVIGGRDGVCSGLQVNPVEAGVFGVKV